ncbi:MAG TPA: hypothetical protein VH518_06680 [Tepidisphaeraceae bacterium]|jgi:hypothetical protein
MPTKTAIATVLGLILAGAVLAVTVVTLSHHGVARSPDRPDVLPDISPAPTKSFSVDETTPPPSQGRSPMAHAPAPSENPPTTENAIRRPPQPVVQAEPQPVVPLPVAREALAYVGADPAAGEVWYQAINDPNLTAHQRQDLIEDLNEDGFPDPKNLTPNDLPLIVSRLQLIEQVAPEAMDDVNAAAFAEAYKDLVNMYNRLTAAGT